jgi:hypothetical protein
VQGELDGGYRPAGKGQVFCPGDADGEHELRRGTSSGEAPRTVGHGSVDDEQGSEERERESGRARGGREKRSSASNL